MKLRKAVISYNIAFWAFLIAMFLAQIFWGLGAVVNYYVLSTMTFLFVLVSTFLVSHDESPLTEQPRNEDAKTDKSNNVKEDIEPGSDTRLIHATHATAPVPVKKGRIDWIDHLKVLLISLVVVGHSANSIVGAPGFISLGEVQPENSEGTSSNSNYYFAVWLCGYFLLKPAIVPLFFFVSGYFSAASRIKHGPNKFLKKTFWRLGPPAILWWLVVNPVNSYLGYALVKPTNMSYSYSPGQAATWFLTWLMVFNCCYASINVDQDGSIGGRKDIPKFMQIMKVALSASIVQVIVGALVLFSNSGGSFAEMPCLFVGDGYFNALGYASGILARTHGWLIRDNSDESCHDDDDNLVKKSKVCVVVVTLFTIAVCFLFYAPGAPFSSVGESAMGFLVVNLLLFIPAALYSPCSWVCLLSFFQSRSLASQQERSSERSSSGDTDENNNKRSLSFSKFLSGGAFAVYLIHYYFVTLYTYLYLQILDETQDIQVQFVNTTSTAEPALGDGNKFAGFAFVSTLSLVTSFLLGGLLKMIPGLGKFV